jgi:hypothetical protein
MIVILAVSPDHLESWPLVLLQVLKDERSGSRIIHVLAPWFEEVRKQHTT